MKWHAADARLLGQVNGYACSRIFYPLGSYHCFLSQNWYLVLNLPTHAPSFCFVLRQVCLHMGYPHGEGGRLLPRYFTGEYPELVDNYPEFRSLICPP